MKQVPEGARSPATPSAAAPPEAAVSPARQRRQWSPAKGMLLLLSLGFHGFLLWLPLSSPKPTSTQPPPRSVRVVRLPSQGAPKQPVSVRPQSKKPPVVTTQPRVSQPVPAPAKPAPPQAAPAPTPPQSATNSWDDFPHYPTATTGCFGLSACHQTPAALSQVSTFFATTLPTRQYQARLVVNEANRQVYQVSKGTGQPAQFLSVLTAADGQGTVYVLSDAPQELANLANAKEVPMEVIALLNDLGSMDADRSTFAQPEAYYQPDGTVHPQVMTTQLLMDQSFDQLMKTTLKSSLEEKKFQVSNVVASYGGGAVHALTRDAQTFYVNLIPTQDGSGTLIIFWKTLPSSG